MNPKNNKQKQPKDNKNKPTYSRDDAFDADMNQKSYPNKTHLSLWLKKD